MDTIIIFDPAPGPASGVLFSDDFNRANETLESSAAYSTLSGAGELRVASNMVEVSDPATNQRGSYSIVDSGATSSADSTITYEVTFDASGTSYFLFWVRRQDANNSIAFNMISDGTIAWEQFDGGAFTELSSSSITLNSTGVANTVTLTVSGTSLSATVNSETPLGATSSVIQTETGKGFEMENSSTASSTAQDIFLDNLSIS